MTAEGHTIKPVEIKLEDFFTKVLSAIGKTTDEQISELLKKTKTTVAVAESLTGGLISNHLTSIAGATDFFIGGIVCYHNRAKVMEVGVPAAIISKHGPVSKEVAIAMAEGVRRRMRTDIGISATGSAGPKPLPPAPVGLTYIALASEKGTEWKELRLQGGRAEIREKAARAALGLLWLHMGGEEIVNKLEPKK
jgi:nicotinamide-nucleotide amidase